MCGASQGASKRAEQAEVDRQSQIRSSTSAIDRAFSGRQSQLDDFVAALREDFAGEAGRQKEIADRQSKFSLARGGLTGGSAAADAGTRRGREFQAGLLRGERLSQSSLADLTSADATSRQNLLALAQGGASTTTAATSAAEALRSNISSARSSTSIDALGDIFGETRELFETQQDAEARRRGLKESEVFADPFSR